MTAKPSPELLQLLGTVQKVAAKFLRHRREVPSMVQAETRSGQTLVTVMPLEEDRRETKIALAALFAAWDVVRFAVISEAWVLSFPAGPDGKPPPGLDKVRPSKSDRREEWVMIGLGDEENFFFSGTPIRRGKDGTARLGKWLQVANDEDASVFESWMRTLLPQPPIHSEEFRAVLRLGAVLKFGHILIDGCPFEPMLH